MKWLDKKLNWMEENKVKSIVLILLLLGAIIFASGFFAISNPLYVCSNDNDLPNGLLVYEYKENGANNVRVQTGMGHDFEVRTRNNYVGTYKLRITNVGTGQEYTKSYTINSGESIYKYVTIPMTEVGSLGTWYLDLLDSSGVVVVQLNFNFIAFESPTTGDVKFTSSPTDAPVRVDGTLLGRTTFTATLQEGGHSYSAVKSGYGTETGTVYVTAGTTQTVNIVFGSSPTEEPTEDPTSDPTEDPTPDTDGYIAVTGNIEGTGTRVYLDGDVYLGNVGNTFPVDSGIHWIRATADGYNEWVSEDFVINGDTKNIYITFVMDGTPTPTPTPEPEPEPDTSGGIIFGSTVAGLFIVYLVLRNKGKKK